MNTKTKTLVYLRTDLGNEDLQAGGSVAHTLGVIRAYHQAGYRIVIASTALWSVLAREQHDTVWYRLMMPRWLRWLGTKVNAVLSTFFFMPRVMLLCWRERPQALYQRYSLLNMTGVLVSYMMRIPLILEYNGSEVWVERYWTTHQKLRLVWLINFIERRNIRGAHIIVVVSAALRDELIRRGIAPDKILVNPNGVDEHLFNPAALGDERIQVRHTLGLTDKCIVGFIGTFNRWHGIEVLARIIPLVHAVDPTIHFLLIGEGPLRAWLYEQVQLYCTSVTFTGMIAQEQAREYLASCDMFIAPTQPNPDGSAFFGSPTKLFEYMSMARPIIMSDMEHLTPLVQPVLSVHHTVANEHDDACAIVVAPDDIDGFVHAIIMVARWSPAERQRMGINARNRVIREYTWYHHVQRIIAHRNCV